VKDGKPHGKGLLIIKGAALFGDFEDGEIVFGHMMLGTNHFYEGQFKNTQRHGKGITTHPDGTTQEGFFKDD
jgi:hypothetical protein